jgi:hypothetical protein
MQSLKVVSFSIKSEKKYMKQLFELWKIKTNTQKGSSVQGFRKGAEIIQSIVRLLGEIS